jgi:sarcosine oxidase subunit beta
MNADVAVVGGGIHGSSSALHLSRRGYKVIQIEKDSVGQHASGVNAGGARLLLRHPAEIPLSRASMDLWQNLQDLVGDDCGFRRTGQVAVAENEEDLSRLKARAALLHSLGYEHEEFLDLNELFEVLPALARTCIGGLISRRDGLANPYQTTLAFARAAAESGVRTLAPVCATAFRRQAGIWRIETTRGQVEAKFLVNCGGAWGGAVAAALGEPVPIESVAPMMMVSARVPHFLDPVVIGTGRKLTFKQMSNGTVIIGGGHLGRVDTAREETELDFTRLSASARTVLDLFPVMRQATIVRAWSGIEGRMPDDIPVIGPSSTEENAFHAFGFSAHGFQLGPIVGALIAELIDTGRSKLPIDAFAITRFGDGEFGSWEASGGGESRNILTH